MRNPVSAASSEAASFCVELSSTSIWLNAVSSKTSSCGLRDPLQPTSADVPMKHASARVTAALLMSCSLRDLDMDTCLTQLYQRARPGTPGGPAHSCTDPPVLDVAAHALAHRALNGAGHVGSFEPMVRRRVVRVAVLVGFLVAGLGGLAGVAWFETRGQTTPRPVPRVTDDPRFRYDDPLLVSGALGLILDAPPPWSRWIVAPDGGGVSTTADVLFLRHTDGVLLSAAAAMPQEGSGIEPTLRGILEDKIKQYGSQLDDIEWSRERLGNLVDARALAFTLHHQGVAVRSKTWMFVSGSYWVTFGCSAGAPVFATVGEAQCLKAFNSMRLQARP